MQRNYTLRNKSSLEPMTLKLVCFQAYESMAVIITVKNAYTTLIRCVCG